MGTSDKMGVQPHTAAPPCSRPPAAAKLRKTRMVHKTREVCSHIQRHLHAHAHQLRQRCTRQINSECSIVNVHAHQLQQGLEQVNVPVNAHAHRLWQWCTRQEDGG
eukprot:1161871-Pelagomonas_calceolata.AAC.12